MSLEKAILVAVGVLLAIGLGAVITNEVEDQQEIIRDGRE
jgi:hypothetical protein